MLDRDEAEGIWPENVEAVVAYLTVCTQWRIIAQADGSKYAIGLDYPGVETGLKMAQIGTTATLWSDLQMIEIGARAAMNGDG